MDKIDFRNIFMLKDKNKSNFFGGQCKNWYYHSVENREIHFDAKCFSSSTFRVRFFANKVILTEILQQKRGNKFP